MKSNIDKIREFFRDRLATDETQIKEHRGHDIMIKCHIVKVDPSLKLIISFECLDCKEIWKHKCYGNKGEILGFYGTIDYFFSQIDETSRFFNRIELGVYKIIKSIDKENKNEDLELSFVGNNKKLKDTPKDSYELREEDEDIDKYREYIHDKDHSTLKLEEIKRFLNEREDLILDLQEIMEEVDDVSQGCDNYRELKNSLEELVKIWEKNLEIFDIVHADNNKIEGRYKIMHGKYGEYIHDKKHVKPLKLEEIKKLLIEREDLILDLKGIIEGIHTILQRCDNYRDLHNSLEEL